MKKRIALLLAAAMTVSLGAVPMTVAASETTTEVKTYGEDETLKIAYIGWGFADETAMFYTRNFDMIADRFNVEYTLSDAWGTSTSAEDVVEVLPSLIEGGAQAVIVHSMSARIVEICNENQIYFTLSGEVILDEELQALCDASPYYVGTVALDDYNGGYACAEYLINELGCKNMVYLRTATRTLEENRMRGAKQACEDLGAKWIGEYTGKDTAESLRTFVSNNPELDGVICGNGTAGNADTVAQTLESLGKDQDVGFATICSPNGLETYFDYGTLNLVTAGEGIEPTICSMLLINAMRGDRVEEEPFKGFVKFFPVYNSEESEKYAEYFSSQSDELPITADMLEEVWLKKNNPDLSNQFITDWLANEYNIPAFDASHGK